MDDRQQVLAQRAAGHHLDRRLPLGSLADAAGVVGVRDQQGSALLALHARVSGVDAGVLSAAMAGGAIVEVASVRGVFTLVPAPDVDVFTLGSLPDDEASLRHRLAPLRGVLDAAGTSATDALARCADVARSALAAGPLDIGGLSGALTRALPELSPMCRGRCGVEHIDQGLFDLVGEAGVWRRQLEDGTRLFVGLPEPATARPAARRTLVRRYLSCYGPSTAQQLADWCGISPADARRSLGGDGEAIAEVARGTYDLVGRASPLPAVRGVRFLPPRDPYLEGRDRSALVPDRTVQRAIWRAVPTLGVVLVDSDAVATWTSVKAGRRRAPVVSPFAGGDVGGITGLAEEAEAVAALRGWDGIRLGT